MMFPLTKLGKTERVDEDKIGSSKQEVGIEVRLLFKSARTRFRLEKFLKRLGREMRR